MGIAYYQTLQAVQQVIGLYLSLGAFVVGLAMGGYGMHDWDSSRQAKREQALANAQAKIDEQARQAIVAANDEIKKMQMAFDAGQAKAKIITKTNYVKGETYAANTPAMRSAQCVVGPDGVSVIANAISNLQLAAAASVLGLSVSGAVYPQGGDGGGRAVSPVSGQPQPASGLPVQLQQLRPADAGAGQASTGVSRPKPIPIP